MGPTIRRPARTLKTTLRLAAFVAQFEGFRDHAYRDPVGVLTLGYGHTKDVRPGDTISQPEAVRLLKEDLENEYAEGVRRALGDAPTSQSEFEAMVSLAYNIGIGAFARSSIFRRHIEGNHRSAAENFLLYNRAGGQVMRGLVRRREAERALYLGEL